MAPEAEPVFAQPPAEIFNLPEQIPEADAEELERQRLRDEEHQQQMRKLYEKEEKERAAIDAKKQAAKSSLQGWYQQREQDIQRRKKLNQEMEEQSRVDMRRYEQENPWMKVGTLIDFKEANDRKEVARMRSLLLAKKHEG